MEFLHSLTVKEARASQSRPQPQSQTQTRARLRRGNVKGIGTLFQTVKNKTKNEGKGNKDTFQSVDEDDYVIHFPTFKKNERSCGRALIKTIGNKTASMFKRQKIPSFEILHRNEDRDIAIVIMSEDEAKTPNMPDVSDTEKAYINLSFKTDMPSLMYQHPSATVGTPHKTIASVPSDPPASTTFDGADGEDSLPSSDVVLQTFEPTKSIRSIKSIEGLLSLSMYDSYLPTIPTSESLAPAASLLHTSISLMSSYASPLNSADFDAAFEAIFGIKSAPKAISSEGTANTGAPISSQAGVFYI